MPAVKSASEIARKWADVTPRRDADYKAGVQAPVRDWAKETAGAASAYAEGVQDAIGRGAFASGVNKAGNSKWQTGALEKGVTRWGPGVRAAQGTYEKGFQPFRDAIEATTLPPRRRTGDPANIERVAAIASALHAKKIAR
jgi:hypothetical protein